MIIKSIIAFLVIFGVLAGWIGVQHMARAYAARHPELGPVREDGKGCGGLFCLCRDKQTCPRNRLTRAAGRTEGARESSPTLENNRSKPQEKKI